MISKKAQHEIMGFVLIVVIVSVIGLIFLVISLGKTKPIQHNSIEISNLLESAMHYTTDCAAGSDFEPKYKDGQDLIKSCYNEKIGNYQNCLNGINVCDKLDTTMKKLVQDILDVSEDAPNKAFKFRIYFSPLSESEPNEMITTLSQGLFQNCTSKTGGAHLIDASFVNSGTIHTELEVCRG